MPLSDEALESLARAELEKKKDAELADCKILEESVDIKISEDGCTITGRYKSIQDIAEETRLLFEKE